MRILVVSLGIVRVLLKRAMKLLCPYYSVVGSIRDKVVAVLGLLLPLFLVVGFGSPVFFYTRHRKRIEPKRRVSPVAYTLAVIVFGGIAGFLGVTLGTGWACSGANPGNQCGVAAVFFIGPISCFLAMFLVGLSLFLIRPAE